MCFSFLWPPQKTNIFLIYWNLARLHVSACCPDHICQRTDQRSQIYLKKTNFLQTIHNHFHLKQSSHSFKNNHPCIPLTPLPTSTSGQFLWRARTSVHVTKIVTGNISGTWCHRSAGVKTTGKKIIIKKGEKENKFKEIKTKIWKNALFLKTMHHFQKKYFMKTKSLFSKEYPI